MGHLTRAPLREPDYQFYGNFIALLGLVFSVAGATTWMILSQRHQGKLHRICSEWTLVTGSCALCELALLMLGLCRWAKRRLGLNDWVTRRIRRHYGIAQSFPDDTPSRGSLQEAKDRADNAQELKSVKAILGYVAGEVSVAELSSLGHVGLRQPYEYPDECSP